MGDEGPPVNCPSDSAEETSSHRPGKLGELDDPCTSFNVFKLIGAFA